jgi:aspartokinase
LTSKEQNIDTSGFSMKLVMKFGGTSVADGKKLQHVADLVKSYHEKGDQVVVVTSALGGVTDAILDEANTASKEGKVSRVKELIQMPSISLLNWTPVSMRLKKP